MMFIAELVGELFPYIIIGVCMAWHAHRERN